MGLRNKRPDLNGVMVIDKPLGWLSAQICRLIRNRTRGAKVGHAGTLDPLASGVLVICLGRATKLIPILMGSTKQYRAVVDLARVSVSDDLEHEATVIEGARPPSIAEIERACTSMVGEIMQRPPVYSAVHVGGKRAYTLARAGAVPELAPKPVTIHDIKILAYEWPRLSLDIRCGKGTYIRSLARDLGQSLGVGGMLAELRRTASDPFTVVQATLPEALPPVITSDELISVESILARTQSPTDHPPEPDRFVETP